MCENTVARVLLLQAKSLCACACVRVDVSTWHFVDATALRDAMRMEVESGTARPRPKSTSRTSARKTRYAGHFRMAILWWSVSAKASAEIDLHNGFALLVGIQRVVLRTRSGLTKGSPHCTLQRAHLLCQAGFGSPAATVGHSGCVTGLFFVVLGVLFAQGPSSLPHETSTALVVQPYVVAGRLRFLNQYHTQQKSTR